MVEPFSLIIVFVVKNIPSWYKSLRSTLFTKGQEVALDKGKEFAVARGQGLVQRVFHLDEREQLRHLERALKTAAERGLARFETLAERDQYNAIIDTLSQDGPMGETLRQEIMQLFTLAEQPDYAKLSETYNSRQRYYDPTYQDIDAGPYLASFFNALLGELYADSYFRAQLSDVLQLRTAAAMQHSLLDIVDVLKNIYVTLEDKYTTEEFARDVATYTEYIERSEHNLKIVGVVPKDQKADPELKGIFVPLRVTMREQQANSDEQAADAVVAALEHYPCLVLLGGPGSGKSTATKFLAWSHAASNQSASAPAPTTLLAGNPLPLRIELRRLNEERQRANYDFLSFASEVLLKRDGTEINPQMFRELLTRRCMLLLFDGLDEVTTLGQRLELVKEIENFALCYPGNRVLVTSRPVGYELARISHPLFAHAEVQPFNDAQIQQYLENWYTAVLRLSPIPQREREEIDLLLSTLKENSRLHKLAENPLLLTVMTALHRYERLPDRRVLIYDRCADLLLETWARIKGTNKRWQDMKMVKEDQFACVAHLGFVLHERSQEETAGRDKKTEDSTVDVTSRFLCEQIEDYIKKQKLLAERAEQRKEAMRFIALIQEEAGLIVERGTDENNKPLYGFVHRTFQEYFAAADVYEHYQQKEDPKVISQFLKKHLHDPHWHEVILLLLGKLKSGPVTRLLRSILESKLKSLRSCYTEIMQQDLFFVCDCLIEEIKVENTLVEMVVSCLSKLAKTGLFPSQRRKALEYLGRLMQTRQYAEQGRRVLIACVTREDVFDTATRFEAATVLYLFTSMLPEEQQLANQILLNLLQHSDLSFEHFTRIADSLYKTRRNSTEGLKTSQLTNCLLTDLLHHSDLSLHQLRVTAEALYRCSLKDSESQQLAIFTLTDLLHRHDLPLQERRVTAEALYRCSLEDSESQQLAIFTLTDMLHSPDLTLKPLQQIAQSLYRSSPTGSEAQQSAISTLTDILHRSESSVEQLQQIAVSLYSRNPTGSESRSFATISLFEGLSVSMPKNSEGPLLATSMLNNLLHRPDLSVAQLRLISTSFGSHINAETQQIAISTLTNMLHRTNLSIDEFRHTVSSLYYTSKFLNSPANSEAKQIVTSTLTSMLQRSDLSTIQRRDIAEFLYKSSAEGSESGLLATSTLLTLISRFNIPINEWFPENLYSSLNQMLPHYHKLPSVTLPALSVSDSAREV